MSNDNTQLEGTLQRIHDLADLPDADVAEAGELLDRDPLIAAGWADRNPAGASGLAARLPSAEQWDAAWERIAEAGPSRLRPLRTGWWHPVAAAACVCLLAVTLRLGHGQLATAAPAENWRLELATDVSVDELEVFGDTTTFVAYEGDFDDPSATAVIWILDDPMTDKGV